jgi:beta propeller repeat protein
MKSLTTGKESALSPGKGDQLWPSISGDRVVWMDNSSGKWQIILCDPKKNATQPLKASLGQQMYPVISGNLVVWQDNRNGDWDIYAYNLKNSSETKLTGPGDQVYPDVSGNIIAWEDKKTGDISYYMWDKKWGRTYPRPGVQTSPVVSGKYISYVDNSAQGSSIRKLDTSTWKDTLVADGPGQVKPSMDKKLVWLDSLTGKPRYQSLDSGQISIICKAPGDKSHPSVGGNDQVGYYATWMDNRSGQPEVYVYSLGQEIELPLAAGPYYNMYPAISGTVIAWMAQTPDKADPSKRAWAIRTFDTSNDNRSELVSALNSPSAVSISDTYLTWADTFADFGWSVYKKLLFGVETREAIPPAGINPRAGKNIVVFQEKDKNSGNWNVFLWNGQDRTQLTQGSGDHINPATDGNTVVWQDNRNGNWDIYAYDLNTSKEIRITKGPAEHTNPDVENGVIVWQDKRNGNWDIYAYDLNTKKEKIICKAPGDQTEPRIGAGKIVWTDNRSGNKDIYIYENYVS